MTQLIRTRNLAPDLTRWDSNRRELLPLAFAEFIDAAATGTSRATFYNTREEQEAAAEAAHRELFAVDRGIYAASLALPGLTDHARQMGILRLLCSPREDQPWMPVETETHAIHTTVEQLPTQRMLKLFGKMRSSRINNARTRRLILSQLLGAKSFEFWVVKYRRKIASALTHAWGRRTASILQAIVAKPAEARSEKERRLVDRHIARFTTEKGLARVEECVRFVFGDERELTLPRLAAYRAAKRDLDRGSSLPFETLEGLRSRFHGERTSAEVLELTKSQLTTSQRMGLQRKASTDKVEVEFDPKRYDAVRLYVYAYEMGMTPAIEEALADKARRTAEQLAITFDHVGILLDASESMMGHDTQHRRPISVALALRDMLAASGRRASIVAGDGRLAAATQLIEPAGDTSLAAGLVTLLKQEVDVVFVLTDGYENAPAGQFAEVVRAARGMGIETPIHQFSPVFAAESQGVRTLSEQVRGLPVSKPEAVGLGLLKVAFEADVERAVETLLGLVRPVITHDARIEEVTHGIP